MALCLTKTGVSWYRVVVAISAFTFKASRKIDALMTVSVFTFIDVYKRESLSLIHI